MDKNFEIKRGQNWKNKKNGMEITIINNLMGGMSLSDLNNLQVRIHNSPGDKPIHFSVEDERNMKNLFYCIFGGVGESIQITREQFLSGEEWEYLEGQDYTD